MGTFNQCIFWCCKFDYFSVIRSPDMKEWYPLIFICVPTKLVVMFSWKLRYGDFKLSFDHVIKSCLHEGGASYHSDICFHQFLWLKLWWNLRFDVYDLSLNRMIKGALSDLRHFLATESPLKMMKNAFYLTSKALFTPKIQWNLPIADIANRGHAINSGQNI